MIHRESLACDTPVAGSRCGAIQGVTGFLCHSVDEMTQSITHVSLLERTRCRQAFEERFSSERMTQEYVRVYGQMLGVPDDAPLPSSDFASRLPASGQACLPYTHEGQVLCRAPALPEHWVFNPYRLLLGLPPSKPGAFPEGRPLVPLGPPPPTDSSPMEPVASGPFWPGTPGLPGTVGASRTCPILSLYSWRSGDLSLLLLIGKAF